MASISPLNDFRSKPIILSTTPTIVYTTPIALSTIILSAQISNVDVATHTFSASLIKRGSSTRTELGLNIPVPRNDAFLLIDGRFVLEELDSLEFSASSNGNLKLILSYLETSA